jgi:hypothetical protein
MITRQCDAKGAHLTTDRDRQMFIKVPVGMELAAKDEGKVLELLRTMYGQKQAPLMWEKNRDAGLEALGMERCPQEPLLFRKLILKGNVDRMICVLVWADDFAFAADPEVETELDELGKRFELTVNPQVEQFISIVFKFENGATSLSQTAYLETILLEFLENPSGERRTAWKKCDDTEFDSAKEPTANDTEYLKNRNYYRLVGLLQYLTITRPVIQYAVGKLARHTTKTRRIHWERAQELLEYLNAFRSHGLLYRQTGNLTLEGYGDADFAGDSETRRSTSGILIRLGESAVLSFSKRQPVVADSTVSAEVIASCSLAKEIIWVRNVLAWFGYPPDGPTKIWCDNKGTVFNIEEGALRHKTKHMDIKYMFLRDLVRQGLITISHCPDSSMYADILTKGLGWIKFNFCRDAFGECNITNL